ncbi:hypothetical protein J4Q44_G00175110 [Coregonus suidteri]|uniref:Uncharacterized protein n=1 Tax=Coregonus suidteri TaxID=861788 RepID=A0AAN8LNP4_9TELE
MSMQGKEMGVLWHVPGATQEVSDLEQAPFSKQTSLLLHLHLRHLASLSTYKGFSSLHSLFKPLAAVLGYIIPSINMLLTYVINLRLLVQGDYLMNPQNDCHILQCSKSHYIQDLRWVHHIM